MVEVFAKPHFIQCHYVSVKSYNGKTVCSSFLRQIQKIRSCITTQDLLQVGPHILIDDQKWRCTPQENGVTRCKLSLDQSLHLVSQEVSPNPLGTDLPPNAPGQMVFFSIPHISSSCKSGGCSFGSCSKYIHHNWSSAGRAHRPHIAFASSFPK